MIVSEAIYGDCEVYYYRLLFYMSSKTIGLKDNFSSEVKYMMDYFDFSTMKENLRVFCKKHEFVQFSIKRNMTSQLVFRVDYCKNKD